MLDDAIATAYRRTEHLHFAFPLTCPNQHVEILTHNVEYACALESANADLFIQSPVYGRYQVCNWRPG